MEPFTVGVLWLVIVGFIIAFILAFGIGANDVANSFGTSVGSKVLTLRQACWLATVCEISGAVLIGYKVSDTVRKGILDVTMYEGAEQELMMGCLAALSSSAVWLLVATFLKLPISGTHSIVGSTIGFSLVARGTNGLNWTTLGTIVASWFISPVLSGLVSTSLYWLIQRMIVFAKNPLRAGLLSLPVFYGITVAVNVLSIVHDGPKLLYMDNIPTWMALTISAGVGLLIAVLVQVVLVPLHRRQILNRPVEFTFGDSDADSSPGGSPKRAKRPLSLVGSDQLPSITETTELVSLTNGKIAAITPHPPTNTNIFCDPNIVKKNGFPLQKGGGGDYKINPEIIKKAENLLGKASLDNTDLTVTSLNYIDEYQNGGVGINNKSPFVNYFDRQKSSPDSTHLIKSPNTPNGKIVASKTGVNPIPDISSQVLNNNNNLKNLNNNKPDLTNNVESAGSLDQMVTTTLSPNSSRVPLILGNGNEMVEAKKEEPQDVSQLFSYLQVLTATFGSFAHGGNDVSNAIGPLIGLYLIYKDGSAMQKSETPLWLLVYGGVGIAAGLWIWGRRVIQTVGNDLTKITPTTGFTIEIGAAMTVLMASKIGLPISTTHCKVGSVVFVGYANASKSCKPNNRRKELGMDEEDGLHGRDEPQEKAVDWGLFRNIVYAWVITVPIAGALSAAIMYMLMTFVL